MVYSFLVTLFSLINWIKHPYRIIKKKPTSLRLIQVINKKRVHQEVNLPIKSVFRLLTSFEGKIHSRFLSAGYSIYKYILLFMFSHMNLVSVKNDSITNKKCEFFPRTFHMTRHRFRPDIMQICVPFKMSTPTKTMVRS